MRKAFTLIEVLFAVIIMSLVGLALLQSSANNTKLIAYNAHKNSFTLLASTFMLNMNDTLHHSTKSLDELLNKKYKFDDNTREFLKDKSLTFERVERDEITLKKTFISNGRLTFIVTKYSMQGDFGAYMYTIESKGQ